MKEHGTLSLIACIVLLTWLSQKDLIISVFPLKENQFMRRDVRQQACVICGADREMILMKSFLLFVLIVDAPFASSILDKRLYEGHLSYNIYMSRMLKRCGWHDGPLLLSQKRQRQGVLEETARFPELYFRSPPKTIEETKTPTLSTI